jgi:hypothetical protein
VTSPPPVGVRTKLPENPLADRDENHAEMWVDTPRGRVHVYTYGANGKSGFLCDTDLVGCN